MSFLTQKLIRKKVKPALSRMNTLHGLGAEREPCKEMVYFRQIWDKEPCHPETISDEKCCLYIVARVRR